MATINTGNINQFNVRGTGTTINSPTFRLPTTATCVVSVHVEGISDCTTTGT